MQDIDAIQNLKQGDISALDVLVRRYQVQAIRTAYLITYDEGLAKDASQNAFLKVYHRIDTFNTAYAFKPWFMRIVVNEALKVVRPHKRIIPLQALVADDIAWEEVLPDISHNPDDEIDQTDLKQAVNQALAQLPPEQRAAIVMKYYLGYKVTEIASEFKQPAGTVKTRLNRARKLLKGLLAPFSNRGVLS